MSLLIDINEKLRQSQYVRAFKLIAKYDYQESNQVTIKIMRRYSYCCNKLLNNYLSQYGKKSHKVKPMLYRAFDALINWGIYLQKEETRNLVFSPRRMSIISPTNMVEKVTKKIKRENKWLALQKKMFLKSLMVTLSYFFMHLKLKNESLVYLVLKKILLLSYFIDQHYKLESNSILARQQMLSLIANGYMELGSMNKCIDHLRVSICMGVEKLIAPLLHKKELHERSVDDKKFKSTLLKCTQQTVVQLDLISMAYEHMQQLTQALRALSLAKLLCQILTFYEARELADYIDNRYMDLQFKYEDPVLDEYELLKFVQMAWEVPAPELKYFHQPTFYEELHQKFKIKTVQPQLLPVGGHDDQENEYPPASLKHSKKPSEISDSTIYSGRHSKTGSEIHFFQETNGLTSLSIVQPCEFAKNFKRFEPKQRKVKASANNYLARLLKMDSDKAEAPATVPVTRRESKHSFRTLDQEISGQIKSKLSFKNEEFEGAKSKCSRLITQERELKKEFPFTYDMLMFRKGFGSGVAVLKESIMEFNVHFEFNVLKYFDYLTTNRNSAMQSVASNQHFQSLRLAEQKLLQSRNLVLKKQFEPYVQEKKDSEKQLQENEKQAQSLLQTVQSQHTIKHSTIRLVSPMLQSEATHQTKMSERVERAERVEGVTVDQHQKQRNFTLAQQTIKQQLLVKEMSEKSAGDGGSTKSTLIILGKSDLAKSVKHFSTKKYAKVLRNTFNNLIKFKKS